MFSDILREATERLDNLEFETLRKLAILHKGWSHGYPKKPRPKQPFPPVIDPLPVDVLYIKQGQKVFIEVWVEEWNEWRPSELNWHTGYVSLNAAESRRRQRELCDETLFEIYRKAFVQRDDGHVTHVGPLNAYRIREIF
jgi:hypothetical protein